MTKSPRAPAIPAGTGPSGRKLWAALVADYVFDEHEMALLREAVRTVDMLDKLHDVVTRDGIMVVITREGIVVDSKLHPALVESRQLKIALARLLAALRLPDGTEGDSTQGRRQRRAGARGVYGRKPA